MTILRIETTEGNGPYQHHKGRTWGYTTKPHHSCTVHRPLPEEDSFNIYKVFKKRTAGQYRFGFKNKTQLKSWFTVADRNRLHKAGFIVSEYKTNTHNTHIGHKQILYEQKSAKLIRRFSIEDLQ